MKTVLTFLFAFSAVFSLLGQTREQGPMFGRVCNASAKDKKPSHRAGFFNV